MMKPKRPVMDKDKPVTRPWKPGEDIYGDNVVEASDVDARRLGREIYDSAKEC